MTLGFLGRLIASFVCFSLSSSAQALDDWQPIPSGIITRIAFGSCAKQWEPQPIWKTVAAAKPDLFLFVGDAIYGDWHGDQPFIPTETSLRADWDKLASKPEFVLVRRQMPFMAIWDNHDYGSHNGGAEFELKEMTRKLFLDFFGEPKNSQRRTTPSIYDARIFGSEGQRVQLILLDTRSFRGPFKADQRSAEERKAIGKVGKYLPNDDPSATILGETQWQWLKKQLAKPAELRLIVSSTQIIPNEKGMDEWGVFPHERQRLFDLIESSGTHGVLLLSGNVHFSEVSKIQLVQYPLVEFTSSGMTHVNPTYAKAPKKYRVAGPYVEHNIGLVEIDWQTDPSPRIRLTALGVGDRQGFSYEFALSNLKAHEKDHHQH
jgi:alkaline phosphatase D